MGGFVLIWAIHKFKAAQSKGFDKRKFTREQNKLKLKEYEDRKLKMFGLAANP